MTDRLHVVADFNAEPLVRLLANTTLVDAEVTLAPFGQVHASLAGLTPAADRSIVVWTQPGAVIEGFRRASAFKPVDADQVLEEVRAYAAIIGRVADGARHVLVPTWTTPSAERGYGLLDFRGDIGLSHLLARMNLALADALSAHNSVFVLDAQRWMSAAGARAASPKLWYAAKVPFGQAVFEQAAADIAAAIAGLNGQARRLVILDLDQVLWGGVVGEVGWEGLVLGGHDHVGEAFADFQGALKGLTRRGIQLAVVSKNDEATALEAIDRHPEMQLRRVDLAGWRINWRDKAANVIELLGDINLGADSAVFIDDSPIERARVREAVPGVLVPEWPDDPARYRETLLSLRCFDTPVVTAEDRARSGMYAAERNRQTLRVAASSVDEWLSSLGVRVSLEPLGVGNLERSAQLLNKTNQMNLATRRLSNAELLAWANEPGHVVLTFRVSDKFGESGLTALVGLAFADSVGRLTDFLLSCRVMGRHVEETMIHAAVAEARARGAKQLVAELIPTLRNGPCLEFFQRSGLRESGPNRFVWDTVDEYTCPRGVALQEAARIATSND